ncbi:MAG TPA: hypothetical protein VIX89_02520 [Bryobacteraceae bacterium]
MRASLFFFFYALISAQPTYAFAKLTPAATAAFDRYIELTEARMNRNLDAARFLEIDARPEIKARVRAGETRIESSVTRDNGKPINLPDALVQDWLGTIFIPGASIQKVKAVLQDYDNYKVFYKPEVTESRVVNHTGEEYDVFLRLFKKQVITVVLNTNYHVRYGMLDQQRMYVNSRSTRIAQVSDPKHPEAREEPAGNDGGYLWRLNSYWRFEAADGGVYAECEAISLSRDVPMLVGWAIRGFIEKFPKESMHNTLAGTKTAVVKQK